MDRSMADTLSATYRARHRALEHRGSALPEERRRGRRRMPPSKTETCAASRRAAGGDGPETQNAAPSQGRRFHCPAWTDSSAEPLPPGGGRAHANRRMRHVTMRHRTTSFRLLTIHDVGPPPAIFNQVPPSRPPGDPCNSPPRIPVPSIPMRRRLSPSRFRKLQAAPNSYRG